MLTVEEKDLIPSYFVCKELKESNAQLYERLKNHMDTYKLNELYSVKATGWIADWKDLWEQILWKGGTDLKKYFEGALKSKARNQNNTYETALLRAMIENIDLVEEILV